MWSRARIAIVDICKSTYFVPTRVLIVCARVNTNARKYHTHRTITVAVATLWWATTLPRIAKLCTTTPATILMILCTFLSLLLSLAYLTCPRRMTLPAWHCVDTFLSSLSRAHHALCLSLSFTHPFYTHCLSVAINFGA